MSSPQATISNRASEGAPEAPLVRCLGSLRQLEASLAALEHRAGLLQLKPLAGREWHELLIRKLLPQLGSDPYLVAAVVGGTNIGKSAVFNHLAGAVVSAPTPLASGTRHPVALVPPDFPARHDLAQVFPGFELQPWSGPDQALDQTERHLLFWQTSPVLPARLVLLDTPDVDSDARVNWERADGIRHCADVLIAVLTQQKYNDAAVREFFSKAAAEDKAVYLVFNQVHLPDDEEWWPKWIDTFCRATGIVPEGVFVVPHNRTAAVQNTLPFHPRRYPPADPPEPLPAGDRDALRRELTDLRFDEIKLRTLRGALRRVVDPADGVPAYLAEVAGRSAEFATAAETLSHRQLARIRDWPQLPSRLLVQEIRLWWRQQREGWTRTIHDAYLTVNDTVASGWSWLKNHWGRPEPDPFEAYRQRELDVMLIAVESLYDNLTQLRDLGNDLLRPRLAKLLAGAQRAQLLARLQERHAAEPMAEILRQVVAQQMQTFRTDSPQLYEFLRQLDFVGAAARPAISVALFLAGGIPVVEHVAASVMTEAVLYVAGGAGAVVAGEATVGAAAGGLRSLEAKFRQLETAFVARRLEFFAELLKTELLGELQSDLESAATLSQIPAFAAAQEAVRSLQLDLSMS